MLCLTSNYISSMYGLVALLMDIGLHKVPSKFTIVAVAGMELSMEVHIIPDFRLCRDPQCRV
ncbi:hypothetical protein ACT9XH_02585 [Methanococcoides methylutens]|uniref:hypothetical protein n=1 Tax=Methanococcoides methylutens TaxID=2226 RepID=UPI0040441222